MKDVTVKVPDDTIFIHVLIGVDQPFSSIVMMSKSKSSPYDLDIEFSDEEDME